MLLNGRQEDTSIHHLIYGTCLVLLHSSFSHLWTAPASHRPFNPLCKLYLLHQLFFCGWSSLSGWWLRVCLSGQPATLLLAVKSGAKLGGSPIARHQFFGEPPSLCSLLVMRLYLNFMIYCDNYFMWSCLPRPLFHDGMGMWCLSTCLIMLQLN